MGSYAPMLSFTYDNKCKEITWETRPHTSVQ